jgi:hypothetical protein
MLHNKAQDPRPPFGTWNHLSTRVMSAKYKGVLALLLLGITVYFSEMDIYWRAPPPLDISKDLSLASTSTL